MASSKHAKKQWDQTMAANGIVSRASIKRKRISGRTVKFSRAMRVVDSETRKHILNARLSALEADNYDEGHVNEDDDDFYIGDEEAKTDVRKTKAKKNRSTSNTRLPRTVKSLGQIVFEECGDDGDQEHPASTNYVTAATTSARDSPRQFCSVCGYFAVHSCVRCGSKFCSKRCSNHHRETGCLKFH